MKFHVARELQQRLIRHPPEGWRAEKEVGLLSAPVTNMIGYTPKVDLMLEHLSTQERIWIEFEISRADPVANHAKFGSGHLINPLPPTDAFVFLMSSDIAKGRANLAAHAIYLLRAVGLRAFQMDLLREVDGPTMKQFNHGRLPLDQLPTPDIDEIIAWTKPIGNERDHVTGANEIYYATNPLEVLLNLHRWNDEVKTAEGKASWGKRSVRYLVYEPKTGRFAPSKFCAYTRIRRRDSETDPIVAVPPMTVAAYSKISHDYPIFDGQKAWKHLERLGFDKVSPGECDTAVLTHLESWIAETKDVVRIDPERCQILLSPK